MHRLQIRPLILMSFLVFGCSAKLAVTEASETGDPSGVVYRTAVSLVAVKQVTSYTALNGAVCKIDFVHELVTVPAGKAYAVNVDNTWAWFAANQFAMAFGPTGALTSVSLNSDPQLDETLNAAANVIKEIAPLAAAAGVGVAAAAQVGGAPPCGAFVETKVLCVKLAGDWQTNPKCS